MERVSNEEQAVLLKLARQAIEAKLVDGVAEPELPGGEAMERFVGCFVTLKLGGELRGCIGTLKPLYPLAEVVRQMAVAAAFEDRRFPPLTASEMKQVRISISVLTPSEPMTVDGEADLLAQLRPGVDGLTLEYGHFHATFLPAVWQNVRDGAEFLAHLKRKAGMDPEFWSDDIQWYRYGSDSFAEPE